MQHWQRGFLLAVITAFLWGVLPIALAITLGGTDPYTLTWFRFLTAAVVLGAILARNGSLPQLAALRGTQYGLLVIAVISLAGHFILFLAGLSFTTPGVSQVVGQLSPVFLLLGGVAVFGERLSLQRWFGFALLLCGLLLFFNHRLLELMQPGKGLGSGVAFLALASLAWASFGLTQKELLKRMQAPQILWLVYTGATIVLLPFATPRHLTGLNGLQIGMLIFCCANTLLAYGAMAEAMKCWDVSRISATLALTPLFAIGSSCLFTKAWPGLIHAEQLNILSVAGALMVVSGSAMCALAGGATSTSRDREWWRSSDGVAKIAE